MKSQIPKAVRAGMPQFARFVFVGIVNTLFSYAIYSGLVYLGLGYASANLISLMVGILVSYKTQGIFVFNHSNNRRLIRFAMVWSVIYLFNIFLIGQFIALGLNAYVSGALALPFVMVLSYIAQKFFVFRTSPARGSRRITR